MALASDLLTGRGIQAGGFSEHRAEPGRGDVQPPFPSRPGHPLARSSSEPRGSIAVPRTAGIGAKQAFSVCSRKVLDAP